MRKDRKELFIDMETVLIKNQGAEKSHQYPIQVGFMIPKKELFQSYILLPSQIRVTKRFYDKLWGDYLAADWNEKITIEKMIEILNIKIEEGYIFKGWNIQSFDLRILKGFGLNPEVKFVDLYLELKKFKKSRKILKNIPNLKADTVFKYLSKTDLDEKHLALSDCMLEYYIRRELSKRYERYGFVC